MASTADRFTVQDQMRCWTACEPLMQETLWHNHDIKAHSRDGLSGVHMAEFYIWLFPDSAGNYEIIWITCLRAQWYDDEPWVIRLFLSLDWGHMREEITSIIIEENVLQLEFILHYGRLPEYPPMVFKWQWIIWSSTLKAIQLSELWWIATPNYTFVCLIGLKNHNPQYNNSANRIFGPHKFPVLPAKQGCASGSIQKLSLIPVWKGSLLRELFQTNCKDLWWVFRDWTGLGSDLTSNCVIVQNLRVAEPFYHKLNMFSCFNEMPSGTVAKFRCYSVGI